MIDELFSPLFDTDWGRRLSIAVLIMISISLTISCFYVITTWRHDMSLSTPTLTSTNPSASPKNDTAPQIAQLQNLHLFGTYGAANASMTLPMTSLQLRLVGSIKTTPASQSKVIISEADQPAKVYQTGDVLPSGVRVYAITATSVILEHGGQFEKLPLVRSTLSFKSRPKPLLPIHDSDKE